MKHIFVITSILFLILPSCKDDDCPPDLDSPSNTNLVTTAGSYWVYQWYDIDTSGTKTIRDDRDSVFVAGDTTIRNFEYTIYSGTELGSQQTRFLRDSSGFIIDSRGNQIWNTNSTGEFTSSKNFDVNTTASITNLSHSIDVLGETHNAIERITQACRVDGEPITACDTCQTTQAYYVKSIGEVLNSTAFIGSCNKLEKRLIKYEIK